MFSNDGSKVAWLELAEDGYESDAAHVVVYDLRVEVKYHLDFKRENVEDQAVNRWDRSPDAISVCFYSSALEFLY